MSFGAPLPSTVADRLRGWIEHSLSYGASVSADGAWLYHLSDRGGVPQAWRLPVKGGPAALVLPGDQRAFRVDAAPVGSSVICAVDRGGDEHWQLHSVNGDHREGTPAVRALTSKPEVIHQPGGWRGEFRYVFTANERDRRFFDVHELDLRSSSGRRVLHTEDALLEVEAVRDTRVLVQRANTNLDSDLLLIEEGRTTLWTPHAGEVSCFGDLSKDAVIAAANPDRQFSALVRYRTPGAVEVLKDFAGDVDNLRVDGAGGRVALTVNRDGWSELYLVDLETSETRPVPLAEPGTILGVVWTPDGSGIVVDVSSPTAGAEVYLCELAEGTCRALTHAPVGLPGHVPAPHLGSFTSSDGLRIPYWELRPDRQNPRGTIVWVHGGPEAQARPTFMPFVSFLVLEGWRLILPNVRGSTGYGRTYVHLDDVRRRMDSVRDLRELVRALAALGDAVPGRVGVIGASYGGFMVLSAITTYPELWGAAVDIVGIANFVTFLERTGPWRRKVREDEYGSLERDRAFLESISPIHFSDRIRSPLLVVHGQNDPRVPVSEADQIVAALKSRRVPVEYLRYANEGHGLVRRENRLEAYARAAEFFANHLDPAAPTT